MKCLAVVLPLLLSPLMLVAQNAVETEQQPMVVFNGNAMGGSCPISMHADQGVWDRTVRVWQGQKQQTPQRFGQRILLSLALTSPSPIVSATVKVRGLTGKNRVVQTGRVSGDGVKVMKITFVQTAEGVFSDLYVPGFTSVSSIELIEVSYSDGRVWRMGGSSVCRVTPDPMMLIANQ